MTLTTLPQLNSQGTAYISVGTGSPVVLLHGVGLCAQSWYQQIDALQSHYQVIAPDMPGHGQSEPMANTKPTLKDYLHWLENFLANTIDQPVIMVGHSMGALLVLALAVRKPEICRGIVPISTIYQRTPEARTAVISRAADLRRNPDSDLTAPLARWFDKAADSRYAKQCKHWLLQAQQASYGAAYTVFAQEDGPTQEELSSLALPALFITGELDPNSSPHMSQTMAQHVRRAECLVVPNSKHMTPLTHAEQVNQALIAFLNKQERKNTRAAAS